MGAIARETVTALIFAGGRATRLGGINKAFASAGGKPLIERVLARLSGQCRTAVISANCEIERFEALGYPVIRDLDESRPGPVGALAAAAEAGIIDTEWVLTAPCDAPFLPEDLTARFAAAERLAQSEGRSPTIYVAYADGRRQSTFACMRTSELASARAFLAQGDRKLGLWHASRHAELVEMPDAERFANLNTPEDLRAADLRFGSSEEDEASE